MAPIFPEDCTYEDAMWLLLESQDGRCNICDLQMFRPYDPLNSIRFRENMVQRHMCSEEHLQIYHENAAYLTLYGAKKPKGVVPVLIVENQEILKSPIVAIMEPNGVSVNIRIKNPYSATNPPENWTVGRVEIVRVVRQIKKRSLPPGFDGYTGGRFDFLKDGGACSSAPHFCENGIHFDTNSIRSGSIGGNISLRIMPSPQQTPGVHVDFLWLRIDRYDAATRCQLTPYEELYRLIVVIPKLLDDWMVIGAKLGPFQNTRRNVNVWRCEQAVPWSPNEPITLGFNFLSRNRILGKVNIGSWPLFPHGNKLTFSMVHEKGPNHVKCNIKFGNYSALTSTTAFFVCKFKLRGRPKKNADHRRTTAKDQVQFSLDDSPEDRLDFECGGSDEEGATASAGVSDKTVYFFLIFDLYPNGP